MKTCTCFLLFAIFAYYTNSSPTADKGGVNVALKTVPELNVKGASKNVFKATNTTVIGDNNVPQPHSAVETFTDFMQELVIILNTYNDDIFEDFVHIVAKEINKSPYRRHNEYKNLLAQESNFLMSKSVPAQRAVINQIVDVMKLLKIFDPNLRELLDYINSLYKDDAKKQFRKILTELKGYSAGYGNSRTRDDFARLIRECVRANILLHTDLNTDVKRKLKKHIDTFMKQIKEFPVSTNKKSITYTVTISDNISTEDKTPKPSLKLNSSKETDIEVKFYMTTKKPEIVYRFENRSNLVERMFEGESTEGQATGESTTTPGKRYLRRTRELPFPGEEFSLEVFDRDRRRSKKSQRRRTSKITPEPGGSGELKDYLKRMRQLQREVSQLKTINEINHNRNSPQSLPYKDDENNGTDEHETKDKKPNNKRKERNNFKKSKHSYEHEPKVHSEVNKVNDDYDSEEDVTTTNSMSGEEQDLGSSAESVDDDIHHHLPSLRNHSHKLQMKKNMRSKSKKTTKEAETSTEPNKHESKKLVLTKRSSEPLSTANDNAFNKKLAKTSIKTNEKIDNTALNVSEEIKRSRIDETATKGIIKDTENNINQTTIAYPFRRFVEAYFPSLFDGHTVKQGLYPAHLWN